MARLEGAGVRSLVKATLTQAVTMVCPSYALTRHVVRPLIDGQRANRIYGFGGLASVNGLHSRATFVIGLPLCHIATGATTLLMPGFGQLQGDDARARLALLRAGPVRVADVSDGGSFGHLGPGARPCVAR